MWADKSKVKDFKRVWIIKHRAAFLLTIPKTAIIFS